MGFYDRDYAADSQPQGMNLGGSRMMVTNIVLVTVGIYVVDIFFTDGRLGELMAVRLEMFHKPWQAYTLLTSGFAHSPTQVTHILFNMLILWFLGRDVEQIYGGKTLLWFYLSTIVLASLVWAGIEYLVLSAAFDGTPEQWAELIRQVRAVGASGGVTGVALVSILHYPKRIILFMLFIPMPIWVLAVVYIAGDTFQAFARDTNVAAVAHLAGASLGYLFFRTQWHLGHLLPRKGSLRGGPKLRVHAPDGDEAGEAAPDKLSQEVDRILAKISREGEASLTRKERRTLEDASRRYQRRNR